MSIIRQVDPMTKARSDLVMGDPFFGTLALRMRMKEDPSCRTAWCDGVTIGFNPEYVKALRPDQRKGLLVHELMHPALGHHVRRGNRKPKAWNVACDYALNPLISKRYALPEGALDNPAWHGKSADEIYNLLPKSNGPGGDGDEDGDEDGDPGNCGEVRDNPRAKDQSQEQSNKQGEAEWKQALAQAKYVAKMAGKLPAELEKLVDDALEPIVDWKTILRRFVSERARDDYTWNRPNRRFIAQGLYLPAPHSERTGALVVIRDTSGSIYADPELLAQFNGELDGIIQDVKPSKVYVVDCDASVNRIVEIEAGEPLPNEMAQACGGGGTDFRPPFTWMKENNIEPKCVVYLTDGYGTFPEEDDSPAPVLWAINTDVEAPFGETVRL